MISARLHTRYRRAIAAATALMLVVASLIGVHAHTIGHHHHHGHDEVVALVALAGDGAVVAAPMTAGCDRGIAVSCGDGSAPSSHPGHGNGHADCGDLSCHGGIAILAAIYAVETRSAGTAFTDATWFLPTSRSSGLERPPRLPV